MIFICFIPLFIFTLLQELNLSSLAIIGKDRSSEMQMQSITAQEHKKMQEETSHFTKQAPFFKLLFLHAIWRIHVFGDKCLTDLISK